MALLCSTVFDIEVDEDTVCGKCFRGLDQYPCASIYEYTKCKQLMFWEAVYDTSLESDKHHPFFVTVCLLLFSYELHRRLSSKNESNKVTVMYGKFAFVVSYSPCSTPTNLRGIRYNYSFFSSFFWLNLNFWFFWSVADPGVVKTNIMREVPSYVSWVAFTILRLLRLLQLPEDGVSSILDAALASPVSESIVLFRLRLIVLLRSSTE